MAWRLAQSLATLRDEINNAVPSRSKASDGTIGDPAHASRASRHNPNNAGVVCAIDITHDPANGLDIHALARKIVQHPQRCLEYVISNGQVAKRRNNFSWEPYRGSNPHRQHAHFAVGQGPDSEPSPPYDDTEPWGVSVLLGAPDPGTVEDDLNDEQNYKLDSAWKAIGRIEAKVAALADVDAFAEKIAGRLAGADIDKATVKAAMQEVFADAAEDG